MPNWEYKLVIVDLTGVNKDETGVRVHQEILPLEKEGWDIERVVDHEGNWLGIMKRENKEEKKEIPETTLEEKLIKIKEEAEYL